jgi:hypothetical protein
MLKTQMIRVIRGQFPTATEVCLLGEFSHWSTAATPMMRVGVGMWEARRDASARLTPAWFIVFDTGQRLGRLVHRSPSDTR